LPILRRLRTPPWVLLALLSASLHVGAIAAIGAGASHVAAAPVFDPASPMLTGETLDVEPAADEPGAATSESPHPSPVDAPLAISVATGPRLPFPSAHMPRSGDAAALRAAGGAQPALFGAVGVRYATDLATSFTRAFPQVASADPWWGTIPFGSAGRADVTLDLDGNGHLAGSTISGSPSPALRRGIERTLALLGARTFTARGAATRLRVVARVGRDDVHDGLHGDVFALSGGSFSGDLGTAFFALPAAAGPGRRIDVELRLLP
jgi:hypothetical protein